MDEKNDNVVDLLFEKAKINFKKNTGVELTPEIFKTPSMRVLNEKRYTEVHACYEALETMVKEYDEDAKIFVKLDLQKIGIFIMIIADMIELRSETPILQEIVRLCDAISCAPADEEDKINLSFFFDNVYDVKKW